MNAETSCIVPVDASKTHSDRLDPWLDDGNIVLVVEGKYFRVHRSVLSSYSGVFKDMFDCTKLRGSEGETSSEEVIDNCPVVRLHDAVTDVQTVLKAMYNRSYPQPYYKKVPLSFISASFRLGEKYNMDEFVNEAKARLRYPCEPMLNTAAEMSSSKTTPLFPDVTGGDPHNFMLMNLLQEMNLRTSLPLVMYQCAIACPLTIIVDGYKFNGSPCSLSPPNLRSWILTKNMLENFRIQLTQTLRASNGCVIQSNCMLQIRRLLSEDIAVGQPFGSWRREWDKWFCDACRRDLNALRNAAIQRAWDQIPMIFGFNSWAEIAKKSDCEV